MIKLKSLTNSFFRALLIMSGAFLLLPSCSKTLSSSSYVVFGTECRMTLPISSHTKYYNILSDMEKKFSYRIETSEIALVNKNAGEKPIEVSDDVFYVVREALRFSKETDGAFNPLLLPIIKLWGWDTGNYRVPSDEELRNALELTRVSDVVLDEQNKTIFLTKKGMGLDLGGIMKGYACDVLYKEMMSDGITEGIINLGGNIFVFGDREYRVAIQEPYAERGNVINSVFVRDKSVVTSGGYERGFTSDGKYYHHIIDPKTGESAKEIYKSVTVVCPSSTVADVYSTAIFVKGEELRGKFLSLYPDSDIITYP